MTSGQLKRQVGLGGAILLGLGSIVGTGVFVSLGLAVGVAGNWAVCALAIATVLATMNALSSAQLAANHPVSGGTYAYGYRYLGPQLGFVAGLSFLLAKSTSAAAAAIGLVSYVSALAGWGNLPVNLLAAGVVMLMTGLVATGLRRANLVNALLVGATLLALFSLIGVAANDGYLLSGQYISQWPSVSAPNLFEAAALLFVAFTGYGRIATLGEEVIAPRRTIPRAIIVTLWVTGILYLGVLLSGLAVLGESGFVREMQLSAAPLQAVAAALDRPGLRLFLSLAAITAMAGVLLNLLLGLSRVAFAMGREGDAPAALANLDGRREPRIATLCVGGVIVLITLFGGLANIWSFSAFAVLVYYAITNLAALQLRDEDRLYPRIISIFGLVGCLGLSVWVTPRAIVVGVAILLIGIGLRATFRR